MITEHPLYGQVEVEAFIPTELPPVAVYSQNFDALTPFADTDGWTVLAGNNGYVADQANARSAGNVYQLGAFVNTTIYATRTVTGLIVGLTYTLAAWVINSTGTSQSVAVGIAGMGNGSAVTPNASSGAWKLVSYTFTATATSHDIRLMILNGSGTRWVSWDDVTLTRHSYLSHVWTPLLADATGLTIRRGGARDGFGIKTDVGLCTFKLLNAQDPMDDGALRPGMALRVLTGDDAPIFTGRIAHLNSVYPLNKETGESRAVTEVTAADAVQIHGSTMRYGVDLGVETDETFEERISRLEASSNAPIDVPEVGAPLEVYAL